MWKIFKKIKGAGLKQTRSVGWSESRVYLSYNTSTAKTRFCVNNGTERVFLSKNTPYLHS